MPRLPVLLAVSLCATALALPGCSRPEPPEKDQPVEPQAAAAKKKSREPPATQLRDYMQAPLNKARTAETTVLEAGEQQRADIEAQTAGNAPPPQQQ